jgi:hypothetical protein
VIKLPGIASETDHHLLLAILNSSLALFWLKQKCFNKGAGEDEERDRYVYAGRKLESLPIAELCTAALSYEIRVSRAGEGATMSAHPREILTLATDKVTQRLAEFSRECAEKGRESALFSMSGIFEKPGEAFDGWYRALQAYVEPAPVLRNGFETYDDLLTLKEVVREERERLRREMIALQEEIDWLVYIAYGLLSSGELRLIPMSPDCAGEISVGQRAFELLAINVAPPSAWPNEVKALWTRRFEIIQSNEHINRIEHQVYKRRWVQPDYEQEFQTAASHWLLDKAEFYMQSMVAERSLIIEKWAAGLWKDPRIRVVAAVWNADSLTAFEKTLKTVIDEHSVPISEVEFRPKHRHIRGTLNVPRERFRFRGDKPRHYSIPSISDN